MNEMDDAERLIEARRLVLEHRRASISLLQRYMRIGYNSASRLIDALEADGTISPMNMTGARTVLKPKPSARDAQ